MVIRVKKGFERKKVTDVDESGIVQQSVDSHFVDVDNDICYTLVVYCGEEFSRRRLRKYIFANRH